VAFTFPGSLSAQNAPKFVPSSCADSSKYPDAKCGTVSVFENREAKSGRQIALNVAVLPALNPEHQPDPFFMIAGGPGQAVVGLFMQGVRKEFIAAVRAKRDIVLLDQRGTGGLPPAP